MSIREEVRARVMQVRVRIVCCDGCGKAVDLPEAFHAPMAPPTWISVSHAVSSDGRRRQDFCSNECMRKGLSVA